jgi:hypothetical protein
MTGRPTKLTADAADAFLTAVRLGATRDLAAQAAGWSPSATYSYLESGRDARHKADTGQRLTAKERRFLEFVEATEKAEGDMAQNALACIVRAAREPRHWTAAAWLLERRYPAEYGRRTELVGPGGGPLQVDATAAAEELLERLRKFQADNEATVEHGRRLRLAPTNGDGPAAS